MINKDFLKGFEKKATPLLFEQSQDNYSSEHDAKSQAILEASYQDDDHGKMHTKRQKGSGKTVKQGPAISSPVNRFGERG